ncbi:MAG: RtcB family protein [Mesorhizobium sp.]|nr:MAG: RtcB family protein [Mesorhizobium sp.]
MKITGKTLIDWGFDPKGRGRSFGEAIETANVMLESGSDEDAVRATVGTLLPPAPPEIPLRTNSLPFNVFLHPENDVEQKNLDLVVGAMDKLVRVPTVEKAVVMPDACPAGVIPVGGVVATKNAIHPGFHSADVCCSMAITVFKRMDDLKKILDVAQEVTHFGPGGRKQGFALPMPLRANLDYNRFTQGRQTKYGDMAETNLGTQGDGNHFLFVGTLRSTGQPAIVTHHGSRGLGALVHKRGLAAAKKHTAIVSPRTDPQAAWIDADTEMGRDYWEALQLVREWTKLNHFVLHDRIQQRIGNSVVDRFWNEHNFVFRRDDGLFYHAKGATPSFAGFSPDDDGRTLIPMNMAEPILLTRHADKEEALGFSPHGAGRNLSRTSYMKTVADADKLLQRETNGVDARFYLGTPDLSELPSAYKNAEQVQRQIHKHRLAEVVDYVDPYGCIMAGEMNWQRKKK